MSWLEVDVRKSCAHVLKTFLPAVRDFACIWNSFFAHMRLCVLVKK